MTTINVEELKKNAYLLTEIFKQAFKARLMNNLKVNSENNYDCQAEWTLEGLELEVLDAHTLMVRTMENYNWDLEAFFKGAANPNIHFFAGKDWREHSPGNWGIKDLEDYDNALLLDAEVKQEAEKAMKNAEIFSKEI